MSNINRLSIKEFTEGSLESGYVKTKNEAWSVLCEKIGESFGHKLLEQKVKMEVGETLGAVYISEKNDAAALKFRGQWFEVYSNLELLHANLDSFVFVLLLDQKRIDNYMVYEEKLKKADKRSPAQSYKVEEDNDELMTLWRSREDKNRKLVN